MTTKEIAIKIIQELPEDASWEDIQERVNFIAGVRKGLKELDEEKGIPHKQVKEDLKRWL
ncbi:MAG: hypothetical protein V5A47_08405 [Bacteroidales bacterium]|nr:hypothetical protein [Bacteroidales bacterium]MBS3775911.1 hypothetical protein [Bacteroidales bacterium]